MGRREEVHNFDGDTGRRTLPDVDGSSSLAPVPPITGQEPLVVQEIYHNLAR